MQIYNKFNAKKHTLFYDNNNIGIMDKYVYRYSIYIAPKYNIKRLLASGCSENSGTH